MNDLIDRQAAIDAIVAWAKDTNEMPDGDDCIMIIGDLPSAQPEPSIPISWIEKQIDWLKSMDNYFSNLTAMNISVLVKKWRIENGKDE